MIKRPSEFSGKKGYRKFFYEEAWKDICEICKKGKSKNLHHKDGNYANDTVDNLISVCSNCHLLIHKIMNWLKTKDQLPIIKICKACRQECTTDNPYVGNGRCLLCYNYVKQFRARRKAVTSPSV